MRFEMLWIYCAHNDGRNHLAATGRHSMDRAEDDTHGQEGGQLPPVVALGEQVDPAAASQVNLALRRDRFDEQLLQPDNQIRVGRRSSTMTHCRSHAGHRRLGQCGCRSSMT